MTKLRFFRFSACRLLSILLVFCFILPVYPTVFASAQPTNIVVGEASGFYGDIVTVPVSFQNVPPQGINNFNFNLHYNTSVLAFISVSPGAIITNEGYFSYNENNGKITFLFSDDTQKDYPIKSDGVCAEIKFKIKDGVAYSPSILNLYVEAFNDVNLIRTDITITVGRVRVMKPALPNPTPTNTPTVTVSPEVSGIIPTLITSPVGTPPSVTPTTSATATPTPSTTITATPTQSTAVTPQKTTSETTATVKTSSIIVLKENLPGNLPAGIPADLVINLSTDKRLYTENEVITYTIKYLNRLNKMASNITISAEMPENATLLDAAGGKVSGNKIEWKLDSLPDRKVGEIVYKLKVGELSEPQTVFSNTAVIESSDNVLINNDNKSICMVMLFSGKLEQPKHIKYVSGYNDNTIKPDNYITRAEVAVMFAKILELNITDNTQVYNDVPSTHWACKYINAVSNAGLFKGYDGNVFKPNEKISRAELATAIFRNLKLKEVMPLETNFTDIIGHWSWGYVEEVYRLKLVNGYGNGQFAPNNKIKRCEVMAMLNRMEYRGPLKGTSVTFSDLPSTHWAYGQVTEATVDHRYSISPDGYEKALVSK